MSEQTNQQTITLTLRRPVKADSIHPGRPEVTIPAGSSYSIPFTAGILKTDVYLPHITLLRESAAVPCDAFRAEFHECGDYCVGGDGWFECWRFEGVGDNDKVLRRCRGDAMRCPSSRVRAEAKEEKHG